MSQRKRLILMRHGQAEATSFSDVDRKLTERGQQDVQNVAKRWWEMGWHPDTAFVSHAVRTQMTWKEIQQATATEIAPNVSGALYLSGFDKLAFELSAVDPKVTSILVVGHNPGLSEIAGQLSAQPVGLATANAALLEIEGSDWIECFSNIGAWQLDQIVTP